MYQRVARLWGATMVVALLGLSVLAHGPEGTRVDDEALVPCRNVHFATQLVPGYDGREEHIPKVIRCALEVQAPLPKYTVTFSEIKAERPRSQAGRYQWDVDITDSSDPSHRQVVDQATFPGEGGCGMEVGDFNLDGFVDVALPRDFAERGGLGGIKNCRRTFLLFDPQTRGFVRNEALSALVGPSFDAPSGEVRTYDDDGRGGALYTVTRYRFEGTALVMQARERRRWDAACRCLATTVEERHGDSLSVVKEETLGEGTGDLYDLTKWDLVNVVRGVLGRIGDVTILVLRSRPEASKDEDDQDLQIDVVLARSGAVLYRFSEQALTPPEGISAEEAERPERGFLTDRVELKDVTNDGTPEVLFTSGVYTGFNEVTLYHAIHCDRTTERCRDARDVRFVTHRRDRFEWGSSKRGTVAVTASPEPDDSCEYRYCAAPFRFTSFVWDPVRARFVVSKSIKTAERLEDDSAERMRYYTRLLLR